MARVGQLVRGAAEAQRHAVRLSMLQGCAKPGRVVSYV